MLGVSIAIVLFMVIRMFARGDPKTMNEQYQRMTNEYLKVIDIPDIDCLRHRHYVP